MRILQDAKNRLHVVRCRGVKYPWFWDGIPFCKHFVFHCGFQNSLNFLNPPPRFIVRSERNPSWTQRSRYRELLNQWCPFHRARRHVHPTPPLTNGLARVSRRTANKKQSDQTALTTKALAKTTNCSCSLVEPKEVEAHDKKIPALRPGRIHCTFKFVPAPLYLAEHKIMTYIGHKTRGKTWGKTLMSRTLFPMFFSVI